MAVEDLNLLAAHALRDKIVAGDLSCVEVTSHFLDRIESQDREIHSFLTVDREAAERRARQLDEDLSRGAPLGPLYGVPVSVKDVYWTAGLRTTGGSLLFRSNVPSEDSVYAERLKAAGAVIIGKTNTPEFAMSWRTINRLGAETVNPWDTHRSTGGSSGGAAASVAAGMCPLAIGGDGGGSIRLPAAFCGVYGLHPSNGRVPRHGGFGSTLAFSGVGPMSRDIRDAAITLQILAQPDDRDPTCAQTPPPDYLAQLNAGIDGVRMLWWCEPDSPADPQVIELVRQAAEKLAKSGASVDELGSSLGVERLTVPFYTITNCDQYVSFGHRVFDDPAQRTLLTSYTSQRFASARATPAADYARALRTRYEYIQTLDRLFRRTDVILSPTVPLIAPDTGEVPPEELPQGLTTYAHLINFTGVTAATVPCGFVKGMPVGLQVIAPRGDESTVLRVSQAAFDLFWPAGMPNAT